MLDTRMTAKFACWMVLALGTAALAVPPSSAAPPAERGNLDHICKVSTLISTPVTNRANTKVAHIRDLVLSPGGDLLYAIVGHGGVGGVGETYTAVPYDVLEVRHADGRWGATLDMTAEDLKKAPMIQSDNYRELTDPQWIARVRQFFPHRGESTTKPEKEAGPAPREPRAVEWVLLASKIRDSRLKNTQNEDLGKIEDLLLDRMHRVAFLIIGRGGVLGAGEHYIPIPWSRVGLSTTPETTAVTVSIDATQAELDKAPVVKSDYANLLDSGFADQVRHYFESLGHGAGAGRR